MGLSFRKRWLAEAVESIRQQSHLADAEDSCFASYYGVKRHRLAPAARQLWLQLDYDADCQAFVDSCYDVSWMQSLAASCLMTCFGWSITDTNGFLGRGQMHVLSTAQAYQLLKHQLSSESSSSLSNSSSSSSSSSSSNQFIVDQTASTLTPPTLITMDDTSSGGQLKLGGKLLDVGAGDGNVTQHLAQLFDQVVATEVSQPMVRRLAERGYTAVHTSSLDAAQLGCDFDCVAFLNVLDRCDKPLTMLRQMRALLASSRPAALLLAVVLPFRPFVESGSHQLKPSERFKELERCSTFEQSVNCLVSSVFPAAGLRVAAFSRVPYISRGDIHRPFYVLSDALFVLAPSD